MSTENMETTEEMDDSTGDLQGKDRQFVTALSRGLEVLRCFKPGERFLGNLEIARYTGLPKPTVSRLTYTLTQLGYLNYSESLRKYSLGMGVLSFGYTLLNNMDIKQITRPYMQELADYAHATVAIGVRDRLEMLYIENCRSNTTSFSLHLDVGSRIPIATTSMGRAYLCAMPELEREHLLDQIRMREPDEWPKIKAGVETALRDYQEKGFCISAGDWQKDVNAVAVPLVLPNGHDILSFNCGAPAFQLRRHMLEDDIGPHLVALVKNVQVAFSRNP